MCIRDRINPIAITVAEKHGVTLGHRMTTAFSENDIDDRNLILTMTEKERDMIYETYEHAINVYTIQEFLGAEGDVKIPFGGGEEEYKEYFDRIHILVRLIAEKLFTEEREDENSNRK